jgi:signal transduction histidine kinase
MVCLFPPLLEPGRKQQVLDFACLNQRQIVDDTSATRDMSTGLAQRAGLRAGSVPVGRSFGLPARLLLLTGLFVLLSEILIFVPSVANFRINWLVDRLTAAHLAALAAEAVPGGNIPAMLQADLLRTAQVTTVAIRRDGQRRMVLAPEKTVDIDATYDLRTMPRGFLTEMGRRVGMITDAVKVFVSPPGKVVRVIGQPRAAPPMVPPEPMGPLDFGADDFVEIVIREAPLKRAMLAFGLNIAGLSLIISAISAALVYLALNRLLVSPMMRITSNMVYFSQNPEDASRIIRPSSRTDEIGTAERELAHMQGELSQLLRQKNRLAQLGLAVSKINHDLRNILASAQLMSDRMMQSAAGVTGDAISRRFQPKFIASLDRAIRLCNDTLRYGRAEEAAPLRQDIVLRDMAADVGDGLDLPRMIDGQTALEWDIGIAPDVTVRADPEQLFRILNNLARNAVQAIEAQAIALDRAAHEARGRVSIKAVRTSAGATVTVSDTGPGVPAKAKANLFKAFQSSNRVGGSGLGLAIAAELVAAHGGRLILAETLSSEGATFQFDLPDDSA